MKIMVSFSPRAHLDLFEKVNFMKTSTKINNTMNYNGIKVASILQRYRRPKCN